MPLLDSSVRVAQLGGQFLLREIRPRAFIYVDERPENAALLRTVPRYSCRFACASCRGDLFEICWLLVLEALKGEKRCRRADAIAWWSESGASAHQVKIR